MITSFLTAISVTAKFSFGSIFLVSLELITLKSSKDRIKTLPNEVPKTISFLSSVQTKRVTFSLDRGLKISSNFFSRRMTDAKNYSDFLLLEFKIYFL